MAGTHAESVLSLSKHRLELISRSTVSCGNDSGKESYFSVLFPKWFAAC